MTTLPLLDRHRVTVHAPREATWQAARAYAGSLAAADRRVLGPALGLSPASGFAVAEEVPGARVALAGQHRFATYQLEFSVDPHGDQTELSATSYALFPFARGRLYRAALLRTHGHVWAVRRLLGTIKTRAELTAR